MQRFFRILSLWICFFALWDEELPVWSCDVCGCLIKTEPEGKELLSPLTGQELGRGKFIAAFNFFYVNWDAFPVREPIDEHDLTDEEFYVTTLRYGVTPDLEVALYIPYVVKHAKNTEEPERLGKKETSDGIGDLTLLGKYRFWKKWVETAFVAGIKFPSGETHEHSGGGERFEPELQPGTGSFDPIVGLAFSKRLGELFLDGSVIDKINTRGVQDYRFGNSLTLTLDASYPLYGSCKKKGFAIYATGEISAQFLAKDKQNGENQSDSGADILFLAPGLRVRATENIVAYIQAPMPAAQNRPAAHQDLDYTILTGVAVRF